MNANDDDDVADRLLEWGLGERLGGAQPPDLVAAVRDRMNRSAGTVRNQRAPSRWLTAAVLLLGIGVVCAVALWPHQADPKAAVPPSVLQEPALAQVASLADAQALPANTRGVEANGVDDAVIGALVRLRDLEVLVVRDAWAEAFGLSLKMKPPEHPRYVTNVSWRHFASFTKLRRLELSGLGQVGRGQGEAGGDVVTALERLPLLERLALRYLDTSDEVLARLSLLPGLRQLDLSFNLGFSEEGVKALLQCRTLVKLSLRGCQQLHGNWIARLHELPDLAELDLSVIDNMNWRSNPGVLDDVDAEIVRKARGWADSLGVGVQDATLAELARAPRLRVLDIGSGRWSHAGLRALGACTTLQELLAFGGNGSDHGFVEELPVGLRRLEVCGDYTDAFCAAVRQHLTSLRHINVAACYQITDRGLADLLAIPTLRVLDMRQMRGLTVASVDALAGAKQLEEIDLRHCDFATARHVLRLRRALPNLEKLETNVTAEELAAAAIAPAPATVRSKRDIEALPADTRGVIATGNDIDDASVEALLRLKDLEWLELVGATSFSTTLGAGPIAIKLSSLTDAGLQHLVSMPALRTLRLVRQHEVRPDLAILRRLPTLVDLQLQDMLLTDRVLENIAQLSSLRQLVLGGSRGNTITAAGLRRLHDLAALRHLDLSNTGLNPDDLRWLPRSVDHLTMRGDGVVRQGVGHDLGAVLAGATPGLSTLDLLGCDSVGIACLKSLQALKSLRVLDLSHCQAFGADSSATDAATVVAHLTALTWLEGLTLRGWTAFSDAHWAVVRTMPNLKRLDTDQGTETLR